MAGASEGDNGEVEGLVDFDRVDQAGRLELVNSKEESTSSRLGHLRIDPARPGVTQFYGNASSVFLVVGATPPRQSTSDNVVGSRAGRC